jgi:hypothetical protein
MCASSPHGVKATEAFMSDSRDGVISIWDVFLITWLEGFRGVIIESDAGALWIGNELGCIFSSFSLAKLH